MKSLRAVQLLLGNSKLVSTVRYLGLWSSDRPGTVHMNDRFECAMGPESMAARSAVVPPQTPQTPHTKRSPRGGDRLTASASAFGLHIALVLGAAAPFSHASQPLWELGLGVGALSLPHYRGSDRTRQWLLPVPYGVYRGEIFRATREGARAVLLESDRLDLDLSVAASAPVDSGDDPARRGMPDLAATVEFGPNVNFTAAKGVNWKLDLRLPVRAVYTLGSEARSIGWTASPVLNLDLQLHGWDIGLQGGPMWGSRAYHAHFYDVATTYATSGRAAYQASGGRAGWRATLGLSRRFSRLWVGGFMRADSVANAVFEASPLVRKRDNVSFGIVLSSVLLTSGTLVSDER